MCKCTVHLYFSCYDLIMIECKQCTHISDWIIQIFVQPKASQRVTNEIIHRKMSEKLSIQLTELVQLKKLLWSRDYLSALVYRQLTLLRCLFCLRHRTLICLLSCKVINWELIVNVERILLGVAVQKATFYGFLLIIRIFIFS